MSLQVQVEVIARSLTRNSSGDEIANVNFLLRRHRTRTKNTIDSCINSATDRFLQRMQVYQIQ